jgi:hypothetical protein
MTKALIAISTYQKDVALLTLLESLVEHNYHVGNRIVVTDDHQGLPYDLDRKSNPNHPLFKGNDLQEIKRPSAVMVVEGFKVKHPDVDIRCVFGKRRGGVAINKNRGILAFMEDESCQELLLLDDDIIMTGPGLLEACRATGEPHMTGMLGSGLQSESFGADACPFFQSFPPKGETPTHFYCEGSMGCMLYFTRECIERVGYMENLSKDGMYGFEHSIFSNRINALYGKYIDWFPILKDCGRFFVSQEIPNNYTADYSQNQKGWAKRKPEIFKGINLHIKNPGC